MALQDIQRAVRQDMQAYCAQIQQNRRHLEPGTRTLSDLLEQQLRSDGDYLQAQLVLIGYDICGGAAMAELIPVARAIQTVHAGAQLLAKGHSLAHANAVHIALAQLANVAAPEALRIKALSITHRSMMLHAQGLAAADKLSDHALFCFATEEILNPLHVGMVFTGVGCPETDAITPFAMAWGRACRAADASDADAAQAALDELDFWPANQLRTIRECYQWHMG